MSTVSIEGKAYPIEEHYQALYRYGKNDAKRHGNERLHTLLSAEYIFNGCNLLKDSAIVDWGCHCGFFSLALADEKIRNKYQGGIVGIDHDKRNIKVCNALKKIHRFDNVVFVRGKVPQKVPEAKSHIIFSILHHVNKSVIFKKRICNILRNAETIYFELAHHNEYPHWSSALIPKRETERNMQPYLFWKANLERQLPEHTVRLIGVHKTHLGTFRPMYLAKKKIKEELIYNKEKYEIFDKFFLPFILFQNNYKNLIKSESKGIYCALADKGGKKYIIMYAKNGERFKAEKYVDGLFLTDIIHFGLLPHYNRSQFVKQLDKIIDKNAQEQGIWNIMVDDESHMHAIESIIEDPSDKASVEACLKSIRNLV